jgi:hypothetical protein
MGSGIILPTLGTLAASASTTLIFSTNANLEAQDSLLDGLSSGDSWTPPQFSEPALTILTVPASTSNTSGQPLLNATDYVFDAVFKVSHRRSGVKTSHPVLTGANISDHFYMKPASIVLEIGMSDVMSAYKDGIWVGSSTKSISAWQTLKSLQSSKTLFTVTTRLDIYSNMMIMDMSAPDDNRTKHGLKATITMEELLAASVQSSSGSSTRPQTTDSTAGGVIQSNSPNLGQIQQFQIPSPLYNGVSLDPNIPGAGDVSSNSVSSLTP